MFNPRYAWEPYLSYGQEKRFDKDVIVFMQGEKGAGFYYLSNGRIKNTFLSGNGETRVISILYSGMLFGEDGSNQNYYTSTAITTAPSLLYYFSDQTLLEICKKHPEAAIVFINCQLYNFRKRIQLIQLLDGNIERQMQYYISEYVDETLDISINQTSLAKDLGTSRVTINKVIRKWKNKGLVEPINRGIRILDENWLRDGSY